MKKLLLLFMVLMSGLIYCEESGKVVGDSTAITNVEPQKVLTAEERIGKQSAEKLVEIYNGWDPSVDLEILYPRVKDYVSDYFNGWMEPLKRGMEDHQALASLYRTFPLGQIESISLREIVQNEIDRVNGVVNGAVSNVAFPSYLDTKSQTFIKDILKQFKADPKLEQFYDQLNPYYKSLKRLSLDYKMMKDEVLSETSRIVDKRLNDYYIKDALQSSILEVANDMGEYVRSLESGLISKHNEEIKKLEVKKDQLKEKYRSTNDPSLEENYKESYFAALGEYKSAKNRGVDQILDVEVNRLYGVVGAFLPTMDEFSITDNIIKMLRDDNPRSKEVYTNILKSKFYTPLISKFQFYFKFNVKEGFRGYRTNVLVLVFMFFALFFFITFMVKRKRGELYIRKIPGLDAIDDAIGRATEMGKPIFFDSGIAGISDPQTIASMLILKNVSKKVAEFKAEIYFPSFDPVVMQVADEMISTGYMDAGFPEDHKKDNVFFLTNDQFAFASGLSGLTARKKPASCFHFGNYAAESLLISEAGFAAGAIQVAGTVQSTQLPFFIAACDHTLIGEELYAAAAYLSKDPMIVSNLKISDYSKIVFGLLFLITTLLLTINSEWTFLRDILESR